MNAIPAFPHTARHQQRGAAALIVTMMLFFAMVLVAVFVNRNLVFEQRSSANQLRSTQAFEAAEAGLEWALAQLDNPQRLAADCTPSTDAAATSFRSRYLNFNRSNASFTPVTWNRAGVLTARSSGRPLGVWSWRAGRASHQSGPGGRLAAPRSGVATAA